MTERLPAHLEAGAIRRQAEALGGHATILQKGDPDRGALILLVERRGAHLACLERSLTGSGYAWRTTGPAQDAAPADLAEFVARRRRADSDAWLIELDIPDGERFIAQMTSQG